jgi:hypothetical protein
LVAPVFAGITPAEPERKNTYYAQWSNGLPSDSTFFPIAVWYQQTSLASQYQAYMYRTIR